MGWFTQRRLITQLLALFLAMAGIALMIGLFGLGETRRVAGVVEDMHENQLRPIQELDEAYRIVADHYHRILYAAQALEARDRQGLGAGLRQDQEAFWRVYAIEMATRPAEGEQEVWARMPADWNAYEQAATQVVALVEAGRLPEAQKLSATVLRPRYEALRDALAREIRMNADEAGKGFLATRAAILMAKRQTLLAILLGLTVAIGLGLAFTHLLVNQVGGELTEASAILTQLSRGELGGTINLRPGDTSSLLARLKVLVQSLNRVTGQAQAIGQGDLSTDLELLSPGDQLGQAINRMNFLLRAGKTEEARRNWLKDGTSALAAALTGDFAMQQLAETAITFMGRQVGAGRGVLYRHRPAEGDLDFLAGYLYSPLAEGKTRFQTGEGTLGQVALDRKTIRLTPAAAVAPTILTGFSSTPAPCTYAFPLSHEDVLLAVGELATFEPLDALQEEFLQGAGPIVSSYLYVALQREKVADLLAIAEGAERQARTQSERLQEANARMEAQQQLLRQQTEELQQSNTMMEEQQQLLHQQTEELQQSNAMMEEQHQQLEQTNQDLRHSQTELDAKAGLLEQSSRYKSEFLANMSHELRTPLNAIILLSRMMTDNATGHLGQEEARWAEVIHRSGHDLLRLINDVLDLSKVEAGRMDLNPSEISSAVLASECQELFASTAREKNLELVIEDRLGGPFISDPDKLAQILRNLLSNAIKFTRNGQVTLVLERRPGSPLPLVLTVRDTGIGIPQDKQGLIFEAFHQADGSTSREFGGTGLGLTISLQFARLLGGTIQVASEPGQGSAFSVHLPERPGFAAAQAEVPGPASPEDDRARLTPGTPTILLIDDDPLFGMALVKINRGLGYATVLAGTGAEGLALARQLRPSGILLDLGLPDMDGADVLHQLKTARDLAAIPVFVVSARDRDWALARKNIVGFLQKPVDDQQIAKAEAALLAAVTQVREGAVLVVGSGGIVAEDLARLLGQATSATQAAPGAQALAALDRQPWRLVIIDLAGQSVDEGLATAQAVREARPEARMLFFSLGSPSEQDEARLRRYSDSIIIQSPQADRRLMDAMARFLQAPPRPGTPPPLDTPPADLNLEGRSILVVDDDPRNLFVLTAALERSQAKVVNAVNGRHALEVLRKGPVDLIFLDIMMPEMDGFQTLAALKADARWSRIPVIALTAKAMPQDREQILAAGADDYLSKPVDYPALLEKAAKWSRKRGSAS